MRRVGWRGEGGLKSRLASLAEPPSIFPPSPILIKFGPGRIGADNPLIWAWASWKMIGHSTVFSAIVLAVLKLLPPAGLGAEDEEVWSDGTSSKIDYPPKSRRLVHKPLATPSFIIVPRCYHTCARYHCSTHATQSNMGKPCCRAEKCTVNGPLLRRPGSSTAGPRATKRRGGRLDL
ncbi:hypothetical protein GQ53DRAFT_745152 [Thozetella sp. PMI_491]|nr:hypothetical protein GQ53DRAFT_745152 [Thozetella sp. PMI_491]